MFDTASRISSSLNDGSLSNLSLGSLTANPRCSLGDLERGRSGLMRSLLVLLRGERDRDGPRYISCISTSLSSSVRLTAGDGNRIPKSAPDQDLDLKEVIVQNSISGTETLLYRETTAWHMRLLWWSGQSSIFAFHRTVQPGQVTFVYGRSHHKGASCQIA